MKTWTLIIDQNPLAGSLNMAVDEYLFLSLGTEPQTCVRFYRWERPTVSLGYSQVAEKVLALDLCRRHGVDIVRRMTGGKLVLHHREVTYSVCSSDATIFSSSLAESYRLISCALVRGLAEMGIEARLAGRPPGFYPRGNWPCFSFPAENEVEIDGRKIIGSAQKRVGSCFLQHGSILLESDAALLRQITPLSAEISQLRMVSLSEALGRKVDFERAVGKLCRGFEAYFGIQFKTRILSPEEWRTIRDIEREKYASPDWTFHRQERTSIDFLKRW